MATTDLEDWTDVYAEAEEHAAPESEPSTHIPPPSEPSTRIPPPSTDLPAPTSETNTASSSTFAPPSPRAHPEPPSPSPQEAPQDGIPAEAISTGDDLVPPPADSTTEAQVLAETTQITHSPPHDEPMNDAPQSTKPTSDPEFLAAAAAQKGSSNAEWQFDSSDGESSSDSSSDSDSSSGSDEDYEMLDPASLAKILMSGDGDDEDGGGSKNKSGKIADHQPRTANEVPDVVVPKPDVSITPETKITFLGNVESIVSNMALIKGATPGEYQVLESGSVLCNESREVIGCIADTFGRVQEPLYSIAFTNAQGVADAGLEYGKKVFYVDEHSTFVFTQPLRNLKGTDASNIHDEEVAEHEAEFSDDEAEAEAKRVKKMAKQAARGGGSGGRVGGRGGGRGGRGARTFGAPGHDSGDYAPGSDAPASTYGGGMSYDDDEDQPSEFYSPLKRPENLSQLMAGGTAPAPAPRGRGDRGRVGGRGRGGNDRGGGRGRGRGDSNSNFRGNAHTFPDRHNAAAPQPQHSLPTKPSAPQGALVENPQLPHQPPSTYQFNGYQFQYNAQAPQQQQAYPQQPQAAYPQQPQQVPGGAYVNPAFFQGQQQQQQYPAWGTQFQGQQGYSGWQQQQQYPTAQQGGQPAHGGPGVPPNLAEILRGLGGAGGGAPPPSS